MRARAAGLPPPGRKGRARSGTPARDRALPPGLEVEAGGEVRVPALPEREVAAQAGSQLGPHRRAWPWRRTGEPQRQRRQAVFEVEHRTLRHRDRRPEGRTPVHPLAAGACAAAMRGIAARRSTPPSASQRASAPRDPLPFPHRALRSPERRVPPPVRARTSWRCQVRGSSSKAGSLMASPRRVRNRYSQSRAYLRNTPKDCSVHSTSPCRPSRKPSCST